MKYNHEEYIARNKKSSIDKFRLPTIQELLTLVDYTKNNPASSIGITSGYYWSSTTYVSFTNSAWGVYFGVGYSSYHNKYSSMYVRCVRETGNGLEWSKDAPKRMTWHEAMEYAESLNV